MALIFCWKGRRLDLGKVILDVFEVRTTGRKVILDVSEVRTKVIYWPKSHFDLCVDEEDNCPVTFQWSLSLR